MKEMIAMPSLDSVGGDLTPDTLEHLVHQIIAERDPSGGSTIAVGRIADRVLAGRTFDSEAERGRAQLCIEHEIARLASQVEGLRYFENE